MLYIIGLKVGPKMYEGDFKTIYYIILFSHIVLAAIIIPLALFTLYRGWNSQLERHRNIAKITLPIWLYVSRYRSCHLFDVILKLNI